MSQFCSADWLLVQPSYNQPFRTPTDRQPFQINARVTGNRNTAYQVAVLACE
ncbi:hypothetical protein [Leptolyngbya sp. NIES-2104]|uniref:hypothetical protein n=1 Tax=Leptolyngbya sp. NIES-2104 TaxID=1552121 RepID=UPI0012E3D9E1|nr:hypothetical protein [Leptolyngbya sp. NIES-2104]